ncbi:glycosyltransferase family 2 protein [Candidatus Uhrbacteria bacterium]|nr:glycosyltransferase family 2 protein [Candidatus Uhrbacteria bacterium]
MLPKSKFYRFLEIIPGVLIWGTLAGAILLSFVRPLWAIIFIILFDLYWLFRVVYFVFYLSLSWKRFKNDGQVDWWKKLQTDLPQWQRLWQVIFLPTYKEDLTVLRTTLNALGRAYFPKERLIVVLAGEEREGPAFTEKVEQLKKEFGQVFPHLLTTIHPQGLPDEIPGKGSNLHFSGKLVKEYIDRLRIPYADIIVSALDVDTAVHPQYFAYLSYRYLTTPNPQHASYQPIALYNNNIWESPALVRLAAWGTTFWLMTELPRSERLFTFSSHSMPWQALVDVGFWQKDIVTEDSRIFLQCFLHYDGNYRVVPLYLPVSMDTVTTGSYVGSLKALYFQQRRWAWGIEHFPYMAWHFLKARAIPVRKKIKFMWNLGEGMYSWATAPILIFLLGQLPFVVGEETLGSSVFFQATPPVLKFIMRAAMIGMIISAVLTFRLLPPVPPGTPRHRRFHILWQWLLLPVSLIVFGSLPAFDAQTRLMFGKYLGFNVTEKVRTKNETRLIQKQAQL